MTARLPARDAAAWLVLALAVFLLFFRLGERGLRNPDEGRYAEIALEMHRSGEWIEPRLYGSDYLKKPPMFYWLLAGSFRVFGRSETAARAVPALFSLAVLAAAYAFTRTRLGRRPALFGAILLATNAWFLQVGRYLVIDAVFTFFVTVCWWAYGLRRDGHGRAWAAEAVFFASMAAAFLTKGLPGIAIPLVTVLLDALIRGDWRQARSVRWWAGVCWLVALTGPWLWAITRKEPEFWQVFFVREHWQRVWSEQFEHQQAWYYYPAMLAVFLLPWVLFARPLREWFAVRRDPAAGGAADTIRYWGICALSTVLFYSAARSKMPTYLLPAVVPASLAIGAAWERWCFAPAEPPRRSAQAALAALLFASVAFLLAFPSLSHHFSRRLVPEAVQAVEWIAGTALAGTVLALRSYRRGGPLRLFAALVAMMTALGVAFPLALEKFNEDYTTRHLARALDGRLGPADRLFVYDNPGPFYDFRFYLDRPVQTVGLEGELDVTRDDFEAGDASVSRERFWTLAESAEPVYCLIRRSDYEGLDERTRSNLIIVSSDRRKVLFANRAAAERKLT